MIIIYRFTLILISFWFLISCSTIIQYAKNNKSCEINSNYSKDSFSFIEVDLNEYKLRLFWKDETGKRFYTFENLKKWFKDNGETPVAITNGGIYEPDYTPTGLYIEKGKVKNPLNLNDGKGNFFLKPNGIFILTDKNAQIIESSQFDNKNIANIKYAQQSGPLLVLNNQIHSVFKKDSYHRKLRNGIGIGKNKKIYIAISNCAVTFYEFATFFRDFLDCPNALYLDGTISNLYASSINKFENGYGKYAVMIGVTSFQKKDKKLKEEQ